VNLSDNFKQIISTVAPLLGTALGGPLGGVAGTFLANALGLPASDPKAIEAKLANADPQTLLALKKADQDFQAHMAELGVDADKLVYDDKASARARELGVKDHTPSVLAYAVTFGFFGVLGFMLGIGKPKEGGDALLVMLGSLGTAWAAIIAYYFGSSLGSASKDATIRTMAGK